MADTAMGEVFGAVHHPLENVQTPFWGCVLENIRAMVGELQLDLAKYQRMGYCLLELNDAAVRRANFLKAENDLLSQRLSYMKGLGQAGPTAAEAPRAQAQRREAAGAFDGGLDGSVDDHIEALFKVLSDLAHTTRPAEPGAALLRRDAGAGARGHAGGAPELHEQAMTGWVPLPTSAPGEHLRGALPHLSAVTSGPLPSQIPLPTFAEADRRLGACWADNFTL